MKDTKEVFMECSHAECRERRPNPVKAVYENPFKKDRLVVGEHTLVVTEVDGVPLHRPQAVPCPGSKKPGKIVRSNGSPYSADLRAAPA